MNRFRSVVLFLILGAVALPAIAAGRKLVINSPVSVGQLRLLEAGKSPSRWGRGGKYIAEARGVVDVPDGPIILMAHDGLLEHPDALAGLGVNSIAFVSLDTCGVGDKFIETLLGIKDLKRIGAVDCDLSDRAVSTIAKFRQIHMLAFNNCLIKGTTLGELSKLSSLSHLILSGNHLSPEAYPQLGSLQSLENLELTRVSADDSKIISLPVLSKLDNLSLTANSQIRGRCLTHLAQFPKLVSIELNGTAVDGEDLLKLKGSSVRKVSIDADRINAGELKKIHQQMPNLNIQLVKRVNSKWPKELFAPLH